jgi:hypothetical protein
MKSHLFKKWPEEAHKEDLESRATVEESMSSTTQPKSDPEDLRKTFAPKPKAEDPEARWERKVKEFNSLTPYESEWGRIGAEQSNGVMFGYMQYRLESGLTVTYTKSNCFPLPVTSAELAFLEGCLNNNFKGDGSDTDPRDKNKREEVLDSLIRFRISMASGGRSVGRLLRVGGDASGEVREAPVESNDRRMEEILDGLKSITHQWRG